MAKGTVNKVIIMGRLGQDPEIRITASGTQVANLNVATTEIGPKDEQGNRQELTEWHRMVAFGHTAELAGKYLKKGSQVYIEGRLQTRKWQDQSGNDRYSTEIVINEMQFVGGRNDTGGQAQPQQGGFQQQAPQQGFQQPQGGFQQQAPQYNNQAPQQQPPSFGDDIGF